MQCKIVREGCWSLVGVLILFATTATAQLPAAYFFDGFDDKSSTHNSPANWKLDAWTQKGKQEVIDGSLVLTPADEPNDVAGYDQNRSETNVYPEGLALGDVSFRTQFSGSRTGLHTVGPDVSRKDRGRRRLRGTRMGGDR